MPSKQPAYSIVTETNKMIISAVVMARAGENVVGGSIASPSISDRGVNELNISTVCMFVNY